MKPNYHHKLFIALLILCGATISKSMAQDTATPATILGIRYFLPENKVPYLNISTKKKIGRKFEPVKSIPIKVYLNEESANNLLGKTITNEKGEGIIYLPASIKSLWDSLDEFKFIAVTDSSSGGDPLTSDVTIKKAVLVIDTTTADDARLVTAQLKEKRGNEWVAVKEVEMKLGIKRLLGNLSVGDAETYTSDSTGVAKAEFKRDSMPGDEKGNFILVARVEDNDSYGNLVVEKTVPWGKIIIADNSFFEQRTLWTTRLKTPYWLLFIAYSIMIGVWGTIIYLVFQIIKIKKIGVSASA